MKPEERLALLEKLDAIQTALVAAATSDPGDIDIYPQVRRELLTHPVIGPKIPDWVRRYPTLEQFWPFIKGKFKTYVERRQFIWDEFAPAVQLVEGFHETTPSDAGIDDLLRNFDKEHVHAVWLKALDRRRSDPEGAITSARALLETVCKHILDDASVSYATDAKLPALYKLTADRLNLAPDQHSERVFKQVLGGCQSVVEGLGALRNRLSDAHGQGKRPVKPSARHAELAVNLAGTMATFLVATWEAREDGGDAN